jgi:hypothetical protein
MNSGFQSTSPSLAESARALPTSFSEDAALRLACREALLHGGMARLQMRTARSSIADFAFVRELNLIQETDTAPIALTLTRGIHDEAGLRSLNDALLERHPHLKAALDALDDRLRLRRWRQWLATCPALAHEAALAAKVGGCDVDLPQPMHQLILALRLATGVNSSDLRISDEKLLQLASAIWLRSSASVEETLSLIIGAPVQIAPRRNDQAIRLRIGPLNWEQYARLVPLPTGWLLPVLAIVTRLIIGPSLPVELVLILRRDDIRPDHAPATVGVLNWTCFPGRHTPPARNPEVLVSAKKVAQALRQVARQSPSFRRQGSP